MLTFYPEFEVDNITDNEIVILLDLSNSMKVLTSHTCTMAVLVFGSLYTVVTVFVNADEFLSLYKNMLFHRVYNSVSVIN